MGVSSRRARRQIAEGATAASAVAAHSPLVDGARAKVEQWQTMRAAQSGMSLALWRLAREPEVTDIVISGVDAWVDRGPGLERVALGLRGEDEVRRLAVGMAAAASRRLDDAQPIVDAVLPGPIRLHAVLAPLASTGTSISLRVLRARPFSFTELVSSRTLTPALASLLEGAVSQRKSLLIAGATGAGKTTLLATLLGLVSPEHRIVTIEEVTELYVDHPHVVSLQARPANIEGEGAVSLEELVRAAMRMRPDRLVLGECRGAEVREVLTALNTGHAGGMATVHANSIGDVPARLAALSMLAGMDPPTTALLAASAFDLVVYLARDSSGRRRVQGIGELQLEHGHLTARPLGA